MVEGGWPYVWAAYALTLSTLALLAGATMWRARYWGARARELRKDKN